MDHIARFAILVRAKTRYVEWANSVRGEEPALTIDEVRTSPTVYLVSPVLEDIEEPTARDLIGAKAVELLEAELARWKDDETTWPENRTPHMFQSWFDVEVIEPVVDLDNDQPIGFPPEDGEVLEALEHCAWCGKDMDPESVWLVPYEPDEEVEDEVRALPVELGDERRATAVRASEFSPAGDDEEDDGDAHAGHHHHHDHHHDHDDDENEEPGRDFVFACCSQACQEKLEDVLGAE